MNRKKLRFPMFFKFLIGCLTLAALLIIGGTLVFQKETRLRNRGNYLEKHLRRYHGYEERIGRAMTGTLELLAADTALGAALAPAPTPTPEGNPPPAGPEVRDVAEG